MRIFPGSQVISRFVLCAALTVQIFIVGQIFLWEYKPQQVQIMHSFALLFLTGAASLLTFFNMQNYVSATQAYVKFLVRSLMLAFVALSSFSMGLFENMPAFLVLLAIIFCALGILVRQSISFFEPKVLTIGEAAGMSLPVPLRVYFVLYLIMDNLAVLCVTTAALVKYT